MIRHPPRSTRTYTLFPYTTLFRSVIEQVCDEIAVGLDDQNSHGLAPWPQRGLASAQDRTPDVGIAWTSAALNTAPTRALPLSDTRAGSLPRNRSEERRVGKECVSTCRSRWSPYH